MLESTLLSIDEHRDKHPLARKCYDWLKSLKPQPHWRPTEEQMYILNWVANTLLSNDGIVERETAKILNGLYNDLKSL